jgi:hypothetical protein
VDKERRSLTDNMRLSERPEHLWPHSCVHLTCQHVAQCSEDVQAPRPRSRRRCSSPRSCRLSHLLVLVQLLRLDADDLAYALALVCARQLRHGKFSGHGRDVLLHAISGEEDECSSEDMLAHGGSASSFIYRPRIGRRYNMAPTPGRTRSTPSIAD